MEDHLAVQSLAALAQPSRLRIVRLLMKAAPDGLAAGEIARATGSLPNTLSANLNILSHSGLVQSRRDGRSVIYSAACDRMGALLAFLVEDCCGGSPEICGPVREAATRATCCEPQLTKEPA